MTRYLNLRYLKQCGEKMDIKVTIRIVDKCPMIYIRDFEFSTFQEALQYLTQIANSELIPQECELDDVSKIAYKQWLKKSNLNGY